MIVELDGTLCEVRKEGGGAETAGLGFGDEYGEKIAFRVKSLQKMK